MYKKFTEPYNTRALETEELYNRYQNVYIPNNKTACDYPPYTCDFASGTVTKDKYIITYYYVPKDATVTVHHYEISKDGNRTTNKVHEDDVTPYKFTNQYTTSPYASNELSGNYKNNYYYNNVFTGTVEGQVDTNNVVVTYYYEAKPSKITVHHYIKGTETKVHADDVINKVYTDTYETRYLNTNELVGDYENNYYYNNEHTGDSLSGTVNKDNYEITYFYELRPSTITVHHYVKGTTTKVHNDDIINTKYTNPYNIVPYEPTDLSGDYNNNYYFNGESSGDDLHGVVSKDNYDIIVYYEARPSLITVHHYLVGTTTKVHDDDFINKHYGDSYTTSSYPTTEIYNPYKNVYCYNDTNEGDGKNGTVNKDSYDVIYYYDLRPSTITVHHYIKGTETKVHDDDIIEKRFTETYEVSPYDTTELNDTYKNWYEFKEVKAGDLVTSTIIGDVYDVTFYYDKRPAKLTIHHYIKGTETKLAEDEVINMKLRDTYETNPKDGSELNKPNYTFDSILGTASGTIYEVEKEITYFYKLKDAKLIVHHLAEDTKAKLCEDRNENVTYQDFYTTDSCTTLNNINYTYKEVVTNDSNSEQRGTKIMGNILQDTVEVTYYYELKPGQIVVHYFLSGTKERVADDVISDGLSSKEFTSEAKVIEGYTLVKKPESNVHIYKEDTQEVIYEYEKNTYRIGVEVTGGVGTITGSEEVKYGDNSKEGNIVITPSEGYEIDKILVDGEEIEVTEASGMTLDNFKNMNKDHKIEVEFTEIEIPVPITGSTTKLIFVALAILATGFIYIGVNSVLRKKYDN